MTATRATLLVALGVAVVLFILSRTEKGAEIAANIVGGTVNKLKAFVGAQEGEKLQVYLDNASPPRWTVGIGHLIRETDTVRGQKLHPFGPITMITPEESEAFFNEDIRDAAEAVDGGVTRLTTTNERTAMISLAYNIGRTAFRNSTLLKLFNAGDKSGAADQFPRWVYSGDKSKPNAGLVARRERERELFLS